MPTPENWQLHDPLSRVCVLIIPSTTAYSAFSSLLAHWVMVSSSLSHCLIRSQSSFIFPSSATDIIPHLSKMVEKNYISRCQHIFVVKISGVAVESEKWVKSLSCVRLFATHWTVAYQASPSMGFFRQEYWSGVAISFSRDLPDPGMETRSPALQADALLSEPQGNRYSSWVRNKSLFSPTLLPSPKVITINNLICTFLALFLWIYVLTKW